MISALNSEDCIFLPDADQWDETKEVEKSYLRSIEKWRRDLPRRVRIARLASDDPAELLRTEAGKTVVMKALEQAEIIPA